ncbi:MAG: fimbria/pilus periplasmic chaperone [Enterobacter sp.]|uniref:fimbria/pilus periplasmic chaperone n=1 Tax=Enterobacter TaxID=547 RepID=UPI001F5B812D|nr:MULTISPECIES: fimbria/pilus periplasmic chaperone [Enterobacter]MDU7509850.1 fimbria/pilus periplasmic chaperone [Enterobacter sp.]
MIPLLSLPHLGTLSLMVSNILKVMLMVTLTWFPCANATIQILTTRVAFNANESEQTVRVNNLSKNPELVQVWLSSTDRLC